MAEQAKFGGRDLFEEGRDAFIAGHSDQVPDDVIDLGPDAMAEWNSGYEGAAEDEQEGP